MLWAIKYILFTLMYEWENGSNQRYRLLLRSINLARHRHIDTQYICQSLHITPVIKSIKSIITNLNKKYVKYLIIMFLRDWKKYSHINTSF